MIKEKRNEVEVVLAVVNEYLNEGKDIPCEVMKYVVQALKLYKENIKYIENSFKYDINNGIIEGTNNLIKCIKRIAFGYRKYDHFISRIFLIKGIIKG